MTCFTGNKKRIPMSTCDYCKAVIEEVEVVITLRGDRENKTEYGWACPECQGLDSFTEIVDDAKDRYIAALEAELKLLRRQASDK